MLGHKISIAGACVVALAVGLGWIAFPIFLNSQVQKAKGLVPGSEIREIWEELPFPLNFKVYVFNVTNYQDVEEERAKPKLKQIGPFVYDEWKKKVNVTDHPDNDTVSFNLMNKWVFNKKLSANLTGNEVVVIPNPLLVGMLGYAERNAPYALKLISKAIPFLFEEQESVFMRTTVNDLLFGGVTINCTSKEIPVKAICFNLKMSEALDHVNDTIYKFSIFGMRNGTADKQRFLVSRGIRDYTTVGKMVKLDGKKKLDYWKGDPCNDLNGTDATIFPPFVTPKDDLVFYSPDICRSLGAKFERHSDYKEIKTLRYNASFGDQSEIPSDTCYCYKEKSCLKKGLMDLFNCTGFPLVASLPHFYDSHEDYVTAVEGLHPEKENHSIAVEIEPMTGSPIYAKLRVQFSLLMHPFENVPITETLPDVILPFIWIEEGLELGDDLIQKFDGQLFAFIRGVNIADWFFTVVGCLLIVVGVGVYFKQKNKNPTSPMSTGNRKMETPTEFIGSTKATNYP